MGGSGRVLARPSDCGKRREPTMGPRLPEPGLSPQTAQKARLEQTGPELIVHRELPKNRRDRFSAWPKPSCRAIAAARLFMLQARKVENLSNPLSLSRRNLRR